MVWTTRLSFSPCVLLAVAIAHSGLLKQISAELTSAHRPESHTPNAGLAQSFCVAPKNPQEGPELSGKRAIPGALDGEIEVYRDEKGIPYVYAASLRDAFFAQGYLHGSDRPWQLERARLAAQGRLAEMFGEDLVSSDAFARGLDICGKVEETAPDIELIDAYSRGITAGLQSLPALPVEFRLLNYEPDMQWTVRDTACTMRHIFLMMSSGITGELAQRLLFKELGEELSEVFRLREEHSSLPINTYGAEPHLYSQDGKRLMTPEPTVQGPDGPDGPDEPDAMLRRIRRRMSSEAAAVGDDYDDVQLPDPSSPWVSPDITSPPAGGSNSWVVAGKHTESGKPLVVADPHLALTTPGWWYPMFFTNYSLSGAQGSEPTVRGASDFRVIGATVPGFPGFYEGHNENFAWGITLSMIDLMDTFIVNITEDQKHYTVDGTDLPLELRTHDIAVKAKDGTKTTKRVSTRHTHHGLLISDFNVADLKTLIDVEHQGIALAAVALQRELPSAYPAAYIRARTWTDMFHAQETFPSTGFSCVWGSTANDYGVFFTGSVPHRLLPVELMRDGTKSVNDWQGFHDHTTLPHIMNPPYHEFLVSANQRVCPDEMGFWGRSQRSSYRAARLTNILTERTHVSWKSKMTVSECAAIEMDTVNEEAKSWMSFVVDNLLKETDEASWCPNSQDLYNAMRQWNFATEPGMFEPSIYKVWPQLFLQHLMARYPRSAVEAILGKAFVSLPLVVDHKNTWKFAIKRLVLAHDKREKSLLSKVLDNRALPDILCDALDETRSVLTHIYDTAAKEEWQLKKFNEHYFNHALASRFPKDVRSTGPIVPAGDDDTVHPVTRSYGILSPNISNDFLRKGTSGSSARLVMDVGNWSKSVWIVPPGVSGWRDSPHYDDFLDSFTTATKLHPMYWTDDEIKQAAEYRLTLIGTSEDTA